MMLGARTGAWAKSGAPLPYDAEVEYLENTGNQWIKTDFIPDQDSQVEFSFMNLNHDTSIYNLWVSGTFLSKNNTKMFGVRISKSDSEIECFTMPVRLHYYGQNIGIKLNAQFRDKTWTIGDVSSDVASDFTCRAPLPLLGINYGTTSYGYQVRAPFIGRIYSFKAWQNGTLVRDFIPVRFANEDGASEGAMFDKASGQLFRNSGTGAFILGPDKTI